MAYASDLKSDGVILVGSIPAPDTTFGIDDSMKLCHYTLSSRQSRICLNMNSMLTRPTSGPTQQERKLVLPYLDMLLLLGPVFLTILTRLYNATRVAAGHRDVVGPVGEGMARGTVTRPPLLMYRSCNGCERPERPAKLGQCRHWFTIARGSGLITRRLAPICLLVRDRLHMCGGGLSPLKLHQFAYGC